jgi:membrane-bound serine protease (ClpP class)
MRFVPSTPWRGFYGRLRELGARWTRRSSATARRTRRSGATDRRTRRSGVTVGRGLTALGVVLAAGLIAFSGEGAGPQPTTRPAGGAIVPITGPIDKIMRDSVQRRLDRALADGKRVIIFEFNTPGGRVDFALEMSHMIKNLPSDVRTVAWVHPEAYSAGALLALACQEIWMSPSSTMGDCAPIAVDPVQGLQPLPNTERAKLESPILQEFRDSAVRNGYDPLLARAMVTAKTEVWWLENSATGQREFVTGDVKKQRIDDVDPDKREWKLVESYTLPGEKPTPVTQPIDGEDTLLTVSQSDAIAFGFARGIVRDTGELTTRLNLAGPPARLEVSGWENFAQWLTDPIIRGILFAIILLGAYMEFHTPGVVLPGVTALIALVIFLGAPYAAGLADIWTILLAVLGVILLVLEIFVIPGFGIAGIAGAVLLLVAVIASFVPTEPGAPPFSLPRSPGTWSALLTGMKVLSVSTLVSILGMVLLAYYLPRSRLAGAIVLQNPCAEKLAVPEVHPELAQPGDIGIVTGDLRPGGQARFGHEVIDVQSQGEYVEAGRRVQVIRREGMCVIVRPLPEDVA